MRVLSSQHNIYFNIYFDTHLEKVENLLIYERATFEEHLFVLSVIILNFMFCDIMTFIYS